MKLYQWNVCLSAGIASTTAVALALQRTEYAFLTVGLGTLSGVAATFLAALLFRRSSSKNEGRDK